MILPIVAYGNPILREKCQEIPPDYPNLHQLIADMWETLYNANGVGLAAPQVNVPIRLFLVDSKQAYESADADERMEFIGDEGIKEVFINPQILKISGSHWLDTEGCLSIPTLQEDVARQQSLTIRYHDEQFTPKEQVFSGKTARMILHEYDHVEGKLYLDYLSPLKRRLLQGKLTKIAKGAIKAKYPMQFV